jgi:hypothetical protein
MSQWVRLWEDMPNDPKWRVIAARCGRPVGEIIAVFVHMMINAGTWNHWGILKNWNDEDVAAALDFKLENVSLIREAMQGKTLDGDHLSGWEKRQTKSADQSAERTAAWRKRKRTEPKQDVTVSDGPVTSGDECVTAGDAEEKRRDKKETKPLVLVKKTKLRSPISENAQPESADKIFYMDHGCGQMDEDWAQFCDHHRSRGTLMLDWRAAWRTWVRNIGKFDAKRVRPTLMNGHNVSPEKLAKSSTTFVPEDTPQWNAWVAHYRENKKPPINKIENRATRQLGWRFPAEWPPSTDH